MVRVSNNVVAHSSRISIHIGGDPSRRRDVRPFNRTHLCRARSASTLQAGGRVLSPERATERALRTKRAGPDATLAAARCWLRANNSRCRMRRPLGRRRTSLRAPPPSRLSILLRAPGAVTPHATTFGRITRLLATSHPQNRALSACCMQRAAPRPAAHRSPGGRVAG